MQERPIPKDSLQENLVVYLKAALGQFSGKPFDTARSMDKTRMSQVKTIGDDIKAPIVFYKQNSLNTIEKEILNNSNIAPPITIEKMPKIVDFFRSLTDDFKARLNDSRIWEGSNLTPKQIEEIKRDMVSAYAFIILYDVRGQKFGRVDQVKENDICSFLINLRTAVLDNIDEKDQLKIIDAIMVDRVDKDVRNALGNGVASLKQVADEKNFQQQKNFITDAFSTLKGTGGFKQGGNEYNFLGEFAKQRVIQESQVTIQKIQASSMDKKQKTELIKLIQDTAKKDLGLKIKEVKTPSPAEERKSQVAQQPSSPKPTRSSDTKKIFGTLRSAYKSLRGSQIEQSKAEPQATFRPYQEGEKMGLPGIDRDERIAIVKKEIKKSEPEKKSDAALQYEKERASYMQPEAHSSQEEVKKPKTEFKIGARHSMNASKEEEKEEAVPVPESPRRPGF